jgi:hypothetical protein
MFCLHGLVAQASGHPAGGEAGGGVLIARLEAAVAGSIGATPPRGSEDQTRQAFEREAQDGLVGTGAGQVDQHLGLPGDDAGGDLQQAQP